LAFAAGLCAPLLALAGDAAADAAARAVTLSPHLQAVLRAVADDMQVLPAGSYLMGDAETDFGDADERPVHPVSVRRFSIARHVVTFAQYDAFTDATDRPRADDAGWGRGRQPLIHVSWEEAQAFILWLNERSALHYRLPSEAEWEYAARAGSKAHFPWGEHYGAGLANGAGRKGRDRYEHTAPVGRFPANAWGLYDMVGNVEQWVADCYRESYAGAPTDGSAVDDGHCAQRVRRGGSWGLAPWFLRADYRNSADPRLHSDAIGFRIARDE
jgi:formylglycine-generating enzyme required for sulfatase activity